MRNSLVVVLFSLASIAAGAAVACGGEATGTPTVPTTSDSDAGAPTTPAVPGSASAAPAASEAPKQ